MKEKVLITIIISLVIFPVTTVAQVIKPKRYNDTIRIACIGNSITYGYGLEKRDKNSYPAKLQQLLGIDYKVNNYGISSRTLLSKGDLPYIKEQTFLDALAFNPHVVIIMLGTNDTKPHNWVYKENYKADYINLVMSFDTLPSKPKIVLCKLVPAFPERWGINNNIIVNEVNPIIANIGNELKLPVIDMHTPFKNKAGLFPDKIHPNNEGADLMARIIYENLIVRKKARKYVLSSSYGASR